MILQCPACKARFAVPDVAIPPQGRRVRCGACKHEWHALHPIMADVPPIASPEPLAAMDEQPPATTGAKASLPAVAKKELPVRPFQFAVAGLAALWLILAFVTYFPGGMNAPVLGGMYAAVGATPTEGLQFSELKMDREEGDGKTRFVVSGSIVNHAAVERLVPTVTVALEDATGRAIWSREYPVHETLQAGEVYPFRIANAETAFADKVTRIVLDMGNSLQLMVR